MMTAIRQFADHLIASGRDRYGSRTTPLFVSQLDLATGTLPPATSRFYAEESHRGGAGPTSNNLQFDNGLIRLLDALTELGHGERYREEMKAYLDYYFKHLPDPKTGLLPWGDHQGYDVVRDQVIPERHEFKNMNPPWNLHYAINPEAVTRAIEGLHLHIYDETKSYAYSRHYPSDDKRIPNSMMESGGAWIASWAFLYGKTGNPKHLEWAERMEAYLWSLRDPGTDLLASHPADPAYPGWRNYFGGLRATRTEYMSQLTTYGPNLLIAADRLGGESGARFRDHALRYIRAFVQRMDIQPDGGFYATFDLVSGKPLFPRITDGWAAVPQMNETFTWGNTVLGIRAAFGLAYAYKVTGENDLRDAFDALLPLYRMEQFGREARRTELPAGLIAEALTSFLHMYRRSGEQAYLRHAETLGDHAMRHYYVDGWFVAGTPVLGRLQDKNVNGWKTYSNRAGCAELALALLRLTLTKQNRIDSIEDNPRSYW